MIGRTLVRVTPLVLLGCGATGSPPPECNAAPAAAVGTWSQVDLPEGVNIPSDPVATDGQELSVFGLRCTDCPYFSLDAAASTWVSMDLAPFGDYSDGGSATSAEPYHYLRLYSQDEGALGFLYDRVALEWQQVVEPADLSVGEAVHWTGNEFLFWGGARYQTNNPNGVLQPDTPGERFYDGALFDPLTGAWRAVPQARPPDSYLWGEGGPSVASVWTSVGLFVWGTTVDRTAAWGAIFDVEAMAWEDLEVGADAPAILESHQLRSMADAVYLYGGRSAGTEPGTFSRRMWRYSLAGSAWTEVPVPEWADPMNGTVVEDKLAFVGRCAGGDLFDPATDTWTPLAVDGAPPSTGVPRGAGSFLTVTDTYYGDTDTNAVWVLDLQDQ